MAAVAGLVWDSRPLGSALVWLVSYLRYWPAFAVPACTAAQDTGGCGQALHWPLASVSTLS